MSSCTVMAKSPASKGATVSPSKSVTCTIDEKSMAETEVVPAALVRSAEFSPPPAT